MLALLPRELIEQILKDPEFDHQTLGRCCLLARSYYPIMLPLLYRRIEIHVLDDHEGNEALVPFDERQTRYSAGSFALVKRFMESPSTAELVREVSFHTGSIYDTKPSLMFTSSRDAFITVMQLLPRLESFDIRHHDDRECVHWLERSWLDLPDRARPGRATLGSLNSDAWIVIQETQRDLKHLVFRNGANDAIRTAPAPVDLRLESLRIINHFLHASQATFDEIFNALVGSSRLSLRSLSTATNAVKDFSSFRNLQRLTLQVGAKDGGRTAFASLSSCADLHALESITLVCGPYDEPDNYTLGALAGALPQQIREFQLYGRRLEETDVLEFLRALPTTSALAFFIFDPAYVTRPTVASIGQDSGPEVDYHEADKVAKERGILLRRGYWRWWDPEAHSSSSTPSPPLVIMTGLAPGHRAFIFFSVQGPLEEFRIPEIESIAKLVSVELSWPVAPDHTRPYMLVGLKGEEDAKKLATRLISVKHIWEFWGQAETYEQLHELVKGAEMREKWEHYAASEKCSWKFTIAGHNRTIALPQQVEIINTFSYMPFKGDINLRFPDLEVGVFEEWEFDWQGKLEREKAAAAAVGGGAVPEEESKAKGKGKAKEVDPDAPANPRMPMKAVWMGRKICDCQRGLIDVYDLKKRAYIGTTSMESEASLLMANQALTAPGKWVYDPFVGTGSMLYTASGFGALTFGSDIDGRQIRGKKKGVSASARQYGVTNRIIDCCSFDMTQHPWRTGELFDAIVTDPPYGVRAGAKRLGREEGAREVLPTLVPGREAEGFHHTWADYVPPSVGWPMEEVISTLVTYSLFMLKPSGRLVFFLPTDNAEYSDVDIPSVPGLKLISNSSQSFGKWARRLVTMEKGNEPEEEWRKAIEGLDRGIRRKGQKSRLEEEREQAGEEGEKKKAGHADFRQRYADGFASVKEGVKKLLVGEEKDGAAQ
ncbi:hypothetical protein JCM8547_003351 [Rhodosporidiobolus lusitaniae]